MIAPRNLDPAATWSYHNGTKHSRQSVYSSMHTLDFANQPRPWKLYADILPLVPLSPHVAVTHTAALDSFGGRPSKSIEHRLPTLEELAAVLLLSAGTTKQLSTPGRAMNFRAAACTGALYHIELYIVTGGLLGLEAGVYHFGVHDNSLRQLRSGDFRGVLAEATAREPAVVHAPATIVYTSTYWRNSWKYQARAYRHCYWDSGTILANSLAAANAHGLPTSVVTGFVDEQINALLDVDQTEETVLELLPLGYVDESAPDAPTIQPLGLKTVPLSPYGGADYPAIREIHAASSLVSQQEVHSWRGRGNPAPTPSTQGVVVALPETPAVEAQLLENVIIKRGSSRRFRREPVPFETLTTILDAAAQRVPLDATAPDALSLTDLYVIVNDVDGLDPGTYYYNRQSRSLELLQPAEMRERSTHLALDQALGGDAAINFYFLADLPNLLAQLGNRGYRAAQLDASITAGWLYLAAYALGIGASGLTFFDDEVVACFSPHATNKSVMFLLAAGVPTRLPVDI